MRALQRYAHVMMARLKSARLGHPLPPGDFFRLSPFLDADRKGLVERAKQLGPLFTTLSGSRVAICVVGLPTARRLLAECGANMKPLSIDIGPVVSKGFLRVMEGDDHRRYRAVFTQAINPAVLDVARSDVAAIMEAALRQFLSASEDDAKRGEILELLAVAVLIRTFLGIRSGSPAFGQLIDSFRKMGSRGFVWKVGRTQKDAFRRIREIFASLLSTASDDIDKITPESVLSQLTDSGGFDETTIGNLIYMIEMGRHDLKSFFSWIVRFLGHDACALQRAAAMEHGGQCRHFAEAFVLESLRMEQSEVLMRLARRDFIFDGFLIPKNTVVRICLWESHKNASVFPQPFEFKADRFVQAAHGPGEYAPFGLDHHRCPAGNWVVGISAMFVQAYARAAIAAPAAQSAHRPG